MCVNTKSYSNPNLFFTLAILIGIFTGWVGGAFCLSLAETISQLFINLLKLVSLPIIFLSLSQLPLAWKI